MVCGPMPAAIPGKMCQITLASLDMISRSLLNVLAAFVRSVRISASRHFRCGWYGTRGFREKWALIFISTRH